MQRKFEAVLGKIEQENDTKFTDLCELARKLDTVGIFKFLRDQHTNIGLAKNHFLYDAKTVVMQMAEEGRTDAVELLVGMFEAKIEQAAEGYARSSRFDLVEGLLLKHDVRDTAARGYAFAGHDDKVANLLDRGAKINFAIYGAARAGNKELVEKLLKDKRCNPASFDLAIAGYAHSEHFELAEALIIRAAEVEKALAPAKNGLHKLFSKSVDHLKGYCQSALGGYAGLGYGQHPDKILRLLAMTAHDDVRKHFTQFFAEHKNHIDPLFNADSHVNEIIQKADRIRHAMSEQKIGYDAALAADKKPEPKPKTNLLKFHKHSHAAVAEAKPAAEVAAVSEVKAEAPKASV